MLCEIIVQDILLLKVVACFQQYGNYKVNLLFKLFFILIIFCRTGIAVLLRLCSRLGGRRKKNMKKYYI